MTPDVPDALVGDPDRLRQILINLVGNAIKFTERGEVVVRVRRERARRHRRGPARSPCIDTGIGIAADKQAAIFQAFTQARRLDDAQVWRHRAGPHHLRAARVADGRPHLGREQPGVGSTFQFTVALPGAANRSRPSCSPASRSSRASPRSSSTTTPPIFGS